MVAGKYRSAIDEYVSRLSRGEQVAEPSVFKIAKQTKSLWESRFGSARKEGEQEGAKKAQLSKEEKAATVEAEGRSDRAQKANEAGDLSYLRKKSREGDMSALLKRLSNVN